jgi:competence protein ComEC
MWRQIVIIIVATLGFTSASASVKLCGYIKGIPQWHQHYLSIDLQTNHQHYYLSWYGHHHLIKPGQHWCVFVVIKTYAQEKSVGFSGWLYWHGYSASGYVRNDPPAQLLSQDPWWYQPAAYWRFKWEHKLWFAMRDDANRDVIQALALGDRAAFKSGRWQTFIRTGTSHLMSISGLHLAMVAAAVFYGVRWLWAWSTWLTNRMEAQQAAMLAALCVAMGYAFMTGLAVPTQRALLMLIVIALAALGLRHTSRFWGWCIAALVVMSINPLIIGQPGAWLSFAAVAWLLWGYRRYQPTTWWGHALYTQWLLFLGLMPLELHFFGQIVWASWLGNLIAIPVVSFVVLPLALLGALLVWVNLSLAQWVLHWADMVFGYLHGYLSWLAQQSWWGIQLQPIAWPWAISLLLFILVILRYCPPDRVRQWLRWLR